MTDQTSTEARYFLIGLQLIFIACKLTGHIDWSWWWVLSPIWLPEASAVVIFAIACIVVGWKSVNGD